MAFLGYSNLLIPVKCSLKSAAMQLLTALHYFVGLLLLDIIFAVGLLLHCSLFPCWTDKPLDFCRV
jgi:hypothetical protein